MIKPAVNNDRKPPYLLTLIANFTAVLLGNFTCYMYLVTLSSKLNSVLSLAHIHFRLLPNQTSSYVNHVSCCLLFMQCELDLRVLSGRWVSVRVAVDACFQFGRISYNDNCQFS